MYKTKIDWCDSTWNPVTGCRHNCEYCYARGIANRFGEFKSSNFASMNDVEDYDTIFELLKKPSNPYPYLFAPTFHRYRLDQPSQWKKPRTIFVCSMADLFGEWVPDEWIQDVFKACKAAPQHRYIFLTKNPDRYIQLAGIGMLPRHHWYGYTATKGSELWRFHHADDCPCINLFVSIEPMLERMTPAFSSHCPADWVIVGAESGSRQGKVIPDREWIRNIQMECEYSGRPIFMKESLSALMGDDFKQEFPWEGEKMKDNLPNYLNPHNVDPSRVEAAPMRNAKPCGLMLNAECAMRNDGEDAGTKHIESLPGNDSIRPGQGIGTVGFVGRGRDKSLLNVCTAFLSKPEQGKPCADKLLTMSNDKAIKILERIETGIYGKIAIGKAIDALRGVKNETD